MASRARPDRKDDHYGYRASVSHICHHLADVRVDKLAGDMVLGMQNRLLNGNGLCADSVTKDYRLLKQALSCTVKMGAFQKSPFIKSVKAPKKRRREPKALDDEGRGRLLATLDGMVDSDLTIDIKLGLSAKLRQEEICGLSWRDVCFKGNLIHVRNAVAKAGGRCTLVRPEWLSPRDIAGVFGMGKTKSYEIYAALPHIYVDRNIRVHKRTIMRELREKERLP